MIIEPERSGKTVSDVCIAFESREKHGTNGRDFYLQYWNSVDIISLCIA